MNPDNPREVRQYNKTLQRAYPDCRVRWSERFHEWFLERRAHYQRIDINPAAYPRDAVDTFIQRRDGYYLAGRYAPNGLPPASLLIQILRANDPDYMDVPGATPEERAANFVSGLEEREQTRVQRERLAQSFYGSGVGGELYDQLAWEEKRRIAVPRTADGLGQ